MADVQVEHGYTRIANTLYEALLRARLPGRHKDVVHAVIRLTYGYGKTTDRIAASQLAALTGIRDRSVRAIVADLASAGILERETERGVSARLHVVKDYETWNCEMRQRTGMRRALSVAGTDPDAPSRTAEVGNQGGRPLEGVAPTRAGPPRDQGSAPPGAGGRPLCDRVQRNSPKKSDTKKKSASGVRRPHAHPKGIELALALGQAIRQSLPNQPLPKTLRQLVAWAVEIERLHRLDGASWESIVAVIAWLPHHRGSDGFAWGRVVLSAEKLRKHFARLEAERRANGRRSTNGRGERPPDRLLADELRRDLADMAPDDPVRAS